MIAYRECCFYFIVVVVRKDLSQVSKTAQSILFYFLLAFSSSPSSSPSCTSSSRSASSHSSSRMISLNAYILLFAPLHRPVLPSVSPGYLHKLIPEDLPEQPEDWKCVMEDIERVIMPGMTHWLV